MKSKEIEAMKKFADECKNAKYNKTEAWTLAVMAGCDEAYERYGTTQRAYEVATEYVKKYLTAEEAIGAFYKTICP